MERLSLQSLRRLFQSLARQQRAFSLLAPRSSQHGTKPPKPSTTWSPSPERRPSAAEQHADHLSSILDHPLFRISPVKPQTSRLGTPETQTPPTSLDPLRLLDDLMAAGRADADVLFRCLKRHLATLPRNGDERRRTLRSSGAGMRIEAWYAASDWNMRRQFLGLRPAVAAAMPYLVGEGRQETVLGWLQVLHDSMGMFAVASLGDLLLPTQSQCVFNVLYELVAAELRYERNVSRAVTHLLLSCRLLPAVGNESGSGSGFTGKASPTRRTALYLADWVCNNGHSTEVRTLSPPLFDAFTRAVAHLCGSHHFFSALLPLYHPSNPDTAPALQFTKTVFAKSAAVARRPQRQRNYLLRLYLEAAHVSLDQGRYANASWFMVHAKQFLGPEEETEENEGVMGELVTA